MGKVGKRDAKSLETGWRDSCYAKRSQTADYYANKQLSPQKKQSPTTFHNPKRPIQHNYFLKRLLRCAVKQLRASERP